MSEIKRFSASTDFAELREHLLEHGYCIIEKLVDASVVDGVLAEMNPYIGDAFGNLEDVETHTRRSGALVARSPASHALVRNPLVLQLAEALLAPHASVVQLSLTQIIAIEPGETAQFLHRDETTWDYVEFPLDWQIELSTIWALDDFTEENGATRIVPGSHRVPTRQFDYSQADSIGAVMPRGSVLVYTGKTVHGGGANVSSGVRHAANINYCAGWLRQEENQYLNLTMEDARALDDGMLQLMGYALGANTIGYVRDFEDPFAVIRPERGSVPISMDLLYTAAKRSPVAADMIRQMTGN